MKRVFLTLNIAREHSCTYTARVLAGQVEVTSFQTTSVADAICETATEGFGVVAFHVWYGGICVGTTLADDIRTDPEGIAQRLMALHGQFKS